MLDLTSFFHLSYGLYIISTKQGEQTAGCIVNTLAQVTATPPQLAVAIHKDNYTAQLIQQSGVFAGVALAQNATMDLIGRFGFQTSRDTDKFAGFATVVDEQGAPYVTEQAVARFSCKVTNTVDIGTHLLFIGTAQAAQTLDASAQPMTYAYYHQVKKGVTPPKASSYKPPEEQGYRCKICGYVHKGETLPPDFICPICKKDASFFEKL